ncbi:MAG: peptidase M20 [Bacteroidetes bacterium]|nr:MAG: peptidase M20 [Bacteroidota bacterium]
MKKFSQLALLIVAVSSCVAQPSRSKDVKKETGENSLAAYEKYIDEHNDAHLKELAELVSFPSISSIPSHKTDIQKAGAWIVNKLKSIGIDNAQIMPTDGLPVVYGSWEKARGKPTVLIYAHYDVQPIKDSTEWLNAPFTPKIENGKIYGRGATDDKGGLMIPVWAVETLLNTDKKLPVNVKFVFESEEEIGGGNLHNFLSRNKELLHADFALNTDFGQENDSTPVIFVAARGSAQMEFIVKTANIDVHSGRGGTTPNAARTLSEIITSFYNKDGSIAIKGFYDKVTPLTEKEREMLKKIPYNASAFMKYSGTTAETGDTNYLPLERQWYRPALEITGIRSGFTGEGFLNIIPASAMARINIRSASDQSTKELIELVEKHINKICPTEAKVTYTFTTYTNPVKLPTDTRAYDYLSSVLNKLYGREPLQVASGATIGALIDMKEQLGIYAYSLGFGQKDEGQHASNEFFRLSSIRKGQLVYCYYLEHVGDEESKLKN